MATVLSLSGSPSATSRTARLLAHLGERLAGDGHDTRALVVRDLPADALLAADAADPRIADAVKLLAAADGVVVGTPVYKAAYSGVLKTLLDLLPQSALRGKTVLPVATGGSAAHTLAVDYALRPVLASLGASHITPGIFVLDRHVTVGADGSVDVAPESGEPLYALVDEFSAVLRRADEQRDRAHDRG